MNAICSLCAQPVNPHGEGVRLQRVGWYDPRRRKGEHGLELGKDTGEAAHALCVERVKLGIAIGQTSFLEVQP
jgi:hypothetical protein